MKLKIIYLLGLLTIFSCSHSPAEYTVKITNLSENSGGSGSVVFSSPNRSDILTNAHVCEVVKNGGLVRTESGKSHFVVGYRVSNLHDLCLISVPTDLGGSINISDYPPANYEHVIVSGHPRLLPTILSPGHLSGREIIQVITGFRDCTSEELVDPSTGIFCAMIGKLPIVKIYEAIVVSSLIQPGSSGSAVFRADNTIGAVIFAGSGDLSYGLAVPFEYVHRFLGYEADTLDVLKPNLTIDFLDASQQRKKYMKRTRELCDRLKKEEEKKVCQVIENDSKIDLLIK